MDIAVFLRWILLLNRSIFFFFFFFFSLRVFLYAGVKLVTDRTPHAIAWHTQRVLCTGVSKQDGAKKKKKKRLQMARTSADAMLGGSPGDA